jgi:hypothetical protein
MESAPNASVTQRRVAVRYDHPRRAKAHHVSSPEFPPETWKGRRSYDAYTSCANPDLVPPGALLMDVAKVVSDRRSTIHRSERACRCTF